MAKCIFCDILDGNISCNMFYQDDDCIAILDKYPIDDGHSLIITKKPYEKLTDMEVEEVAKLFSKIPNIANAIIRATKADAFSIAQNNGKAAKQIIPHVHIHIIPRYNAKGTIWTKRKISKESELSELAQKIKKYLE